MHPPSLAACPLTAGPARRRGRQPRGPSRHSPDRGRPGVWRGIARHSQVALYYNDVVDALPPVRVAACVDADRAASDAVVEPLGDLLLCAHQLAVADGGDGAPLLL